MKKYKRSITRFLVTAVSALALSFSFSPVALAQEYSCAAYGAGEYGDGNTCAGASAPSDGGLVDTGQRVLAFGIPAVMIIAGTVILFRASRERKNHSTDTTTPQ